MTTPNAIEATGLRVSYGELDVLRGIDLAVPAGSVFALLGPNGAGKTTLVKVLTTLINAGAGTARVHGHEVVAAAEQVREVIGVTGQFSAVDPYLTGTENLILMADLAHLGRAPGRARAAELLERLDLADAAGRVASTYSGGMTRRLDLAMTLINRPQVIFLDEPTTGLDPRSRRGMWAIIRELVADGVTVFLTTQYLEEADQLADRIAVLDHGMLVAEGTPAELKAQVPGGRIRLQFLDAADVETAAAALPDGVRTELTLEVPGDGSVASIRALLDRLDAERVEPVQFSVLLPDLDDVFLSLTGHPASTDHPNSDTLAVA